VTLSHAGALKQVDSILSLGEEEAVGGTRDRDPEEMMKVLEICHGELGVKGLGDATKKPSRRGCQDDVVDVEQQVGDVGTLFVSEIEAVKPVCCTKPENRWCHARGACLSPYKDFCRRQT
jgi:hypothetical protein